MKIEKKSKIYIAGHRGFIGSRILSEYQKKGFKKVIVKTRQELDLQNQKAVETFFQEERPEFVIIAAAKVGGIMVNMVRQADFLYENLCIQNNIIWFSNIFNVKKLIFLGSSCIYPRGCPQPIKEEYFMTGILEPTNEGYAIAKIAGMKLCEKITTQYKKNFISIMPCNIYGPGDNFSLQDSHVVAALIKKIVDAERNNSPFVAIWGTGNPRREFLYVDDLASAIYFLMENYDEHQFINVGAGNDISIKDLATLIKGIVGYRGEFMFDSEKPDGMPQKLLDVTRVRNLGWKPKISLEEGIKKTVDWYINH